MSLTTIEHNKSVIKQKKRTSRDAIYSDNRKTRVQ